MARSSFNLFRYKDRGTVVLGRVAQGADAFYLEGGTPRERAAFLVEQLPPR
jgi:hypothetical protein